MYKTAFRNSLFLPLILFATCCFAQTPRVMLPQQVGEFESLRYNQRHNLLLTFSSIKDSPIAGSKAIVWDVKTGKQLFQMTGHEGKFVAAEFSPDGKFIVTATWGTVKVWDGESGKLLYDLSRRYKNYTHGCESLNISDDSRYLVLCTDFGLLSYELRTGEKLNILDESSSPNTRYYSASAALSPDNKYIFISPAKPGDGIRVVEFDSFKVKYTLPALEGWSLSVSKDSKRSFYKTGTQIKAYDISNGHILPSNAHQSSSTGKFIVESSNLSVMYKDTLTSDVFTSHRSTLSSMDETYYIKAGKDCLADVFADPSGIYLGHLQNGKKNNSLKLNTISDDSKTIFTVTTDNQLTSWDRATFQLKTNFDVDVNYHQLSGVRSLNNEGDAALMTSDSTLLLWNVWAKKTLAALPVKVNTFNEYAYKSGNCTGISPDGELLANVDRDSIEIWHIRTRKHLYSLPTGSLRNWQQLEFNRANDRLIYWVSGSLLLFDLTDRKLIREISIDNVERSAIAATLPFSFFSHDGKTIAACFKGLATLWNAENGDFKFQIMVSKKPECRFVTFDHLSKHLLMLSTYPGFFEDKSYATSYDLQTRKIDWQVNLKYLACYAKYSPDDESIVVYDFKRTEFGVLESNTGHLRFENIRPGSSNTTFAFSTNSDQLLVAYDTGQIRLFDVKTGQIIGNEDNTTGKVYVDYGPDSKYILAGGIGDGLRVWDSSLTKLTSTFVPIDRSDYFNGLPSGYYQCTRRAAKGLYYVTKDLEVIAYDQLDIKYNRPDKVLAAVGSPDTALINAYHQAYLKRMEKLGIDTSKFNNEYNIPETDIRYEQAGTKLKLHLKGQDRTSQLERFNVWVNQVPVYGLRGLNLKNRHSKNVDTTMTIILSQGENIVESSVINANGLESYHKPVKFNNAKPTLDTGKVYFIGIGVNKFKDVRYNLDWSVKDISDLAGRLEKKYGKNCLVHTLFEQDVTVDKIKALKQYLLRSSVDDKVIIAYSGHGLFSSSWDYYLSSAQINFQDPTKQGIPYEVLENLLDSIPARQKLMLIDACNSGEIDKPAAARKAILQDPNDLDALLQQAKNDANTSYKSGGVKDQRFFELMQELFVDVRQNTGATIIAASAGTQYAQQKGVLMNGAFTSSILEFLDLPYGQISKLKQYVNKRVPEMTQWRQVPTIRTENDIVDWEL